MRKNIILCLNFGKMLSNLLYHYFMMTNQLLFSISFPFHTNSLLSTGGLTFFSLVGDRLSIPSGSSLEY
jgi:hypothetical protein